MAKMPAQSPDTMADPPDNELVLQFESLGDNCELGLVQRQAGAEPLGLLRFSGTPLRNLLRGLNARFAKIADADHVRVHVENDEYMVKLTRYDFNYHAELKVGEADPADIHRQQCKTVGFLAGKLMDDLEDATKILVFRQNEPLLASDLIDLRATLNAYGPNRLLLVQEACPGHPPGSVIVIDERMMVGYVRRLAERHAVHDLDYLSWMQVLRKAWRVARHAVDGRLVPLTSEPPARLDLTFGHEGNAEPYLGYGWSGPETGYQWAVQERSLITLPLPGRAGEYWLEMAVKPYVCPPLLTGQRLDVIVSGRVVRSFTLSPAEEIGCTVPGALIGDTGTVEIVLNHPHAASPMLFGKGSDDRRLSVSFYRLSLVCT